MARGQRDSGGDKGDSGGDSGEGGGEDGDGTVVQWRGRWGQRGQWTVVGTVGTVGQHSGTAEGTVGTMGQWWEQRG
eukprot:1719782-Pyramimonas_sp.AAC.1